MLFGNEEKVEPRVTGSLTWKMTHLVSTYRKSIHDSDGVKCEIKEVLNALHVETADHVK